MGGVSDTSGEDQESTTFSCYPRRLCVSVGGATALARPGEDDNRDAGGDGSGGVGRDSHDDLGRLLACALLGGDLHHSGDGRGL